MKKIWMIFLLPAISLECAGQSLLKSLSSSRFIINEPENSQIIGYKNNPAFLASMERAGVGIYSERKYLLTELNYHSLVAAINTSSGGFGFYMDFAGSSMYNESKVTVAYGRSIGSSVQVGLQLNRNMVSASEYGKAALFSVTAGSLWQVSENLLAGIMMEETVKKNFGQDDTEKWPGAYSLSFLYDVSDKFAMGMEILKWQEDRVQLISAFHYQPVIKAKILAGISIPDAVSFMGINYSLGTLTLGMYTQYHLQLGISPGISISVHFKKIEK